GPAAATTRLNENEQDDCSQEEEEGGGQEPGDLLAEAAGEKPSDAGFAPAASLTSATDGPRLIAGEPAENVVAEGEFEERIRLGAADIGSTVEGGELDEGDPPADASDHRPDRYEQPQQTLGLGRACEEDPRSGETGHDEEDLELLGQDPQPQADAGEDEPQGDAARRSGVCAGQSAQTVLGRDDRRDHEGHEQRVRVVEAEH